MCIWLIVSTGKNISPQKQRFGALLGFELRALCLLGKSLPLGSHLVQAVHIPSNPLGPRPGPRSAFCLLNEYLKDPKSQVLAGAGKGSEAHTKDTIASLLPNERIR
jgi:hypothetical protein